MTARLLIAKRIRLLSVFLALSFLIAACAGGAEDASSEATSAEGEEEGAAEGAAEAPDEVAVGVILPLTGAGAGLAEIILPAVEMAADDVTEEGTMAGAAMRLIIEDHRGEAGAATSAMQKLVNVDNVEAVLSSYSSATLAILPLADEQGVVVVQSGAQADSLAGASEYLFNGIPLSAAETDGLLQYLSEEGGVETAAIAYLNDDSGNTTRDSLAASAERYGVEIVGDESHGLEQTDFRGQVISLTSSNPDAVLMGTHSLPAALLAEQIREGGYEGIVAGTTFMTTPDLLESDASEGLIHSSVQYDPPDEWVEQFEERAGFAPGVYSGLFYDGIRILGTAIDHVIEQGQEVTGENIRDAIIEIGEFEGVTGTTEFRDDGTSIKPLAINEIRDNQSEIIATIEQDSGDS